MGLKSNEKLSQGIRRLAKKQAAGIRKHLKPKRISRELESVHKARRRIKKLRALLQLVHGELGHQVYYRQKTALRKMARALSGVRDATVQLKTLASLRQSSSGQIPGKKFIALKQGLLRTLAGRLHRLKSSETLSSAKLQRLEQGLKCWKIKNIKPRRLQAGIKKARDRFVAARRQAKQAPNDERIHEWRKRTKDLLYQSCFLKSLSPEFFGSFICGLKKLGRCLGDAHDLAMLEITITNRKPHILKGLLASLRTRRLRLRKSAFALAGQRDMFPDSGFLP